MIQQSITINETIFIVFIKKVGAASNVKHP